MPLPRRSVRLLSVAIASMLLIAGVFIQAAPPVATVVVKPSAMAGWYFWNDKNDTFGGSPGQLVAGPVPAPLGSGSVRLGPLTDNGATAAGHSVIATDAYSGTPIANLTNLSYSTYQTGPTLAIAVQFDVRYRATDTAYGGRLIFEPYQNGTVTVGSGWQTWSPLNGTWWASKTTAAGSNGLCPQASPCTWNQIKTSFPAAQIFGRFLLKAGSNWNGFDGNADALTIGISGADTTFDFEAEVGCTADCYVDAASGNDTFGGGSPASAKKTIQAAVAQVSTGGTVHVAAGNYSGPINIGRAMTLNGVQTGNDPVAGRIGAESTITGLTTIQAASVTIDGFTLTNPFVTGLAEAILIKTAASGAIVRNNIVSGVGGATNTSNSHALYLENGPDDVQVVHNVIRNVSAKVGSVSAVLIGDSLSTNPSTNILIQGNAISNIKSGYRGAYGVSINNGAGVAPGPTRGYTTVQILDNTIDDLAGGVNPDPASPYRGWAHGIGLEGDTPGAIVTGNRISNVVDANFDPGSPIPLDAIAVYFEANAAFATAQVTNNTFDNVEIGTAISAALLSASLPGATVATCNWWGDASGPNLLQVPPAPPSGPGTGSKVTPQVTFAPWKIAPNGPCAGGLPACAAGSYRAAPADLACTPAPVGTYVPNAGATEPTSCEVGTYQPLTGQTSCQLAPAGSFVPTTGATASTLCAPGTYASLDGSAGCSMAVPGTFVPSAGAIAATSCPAGQFQSLFGQTSCVDAPLGSFVGAPGAASATACPAGTFADQPGSSVCTPAAPGSFVAGVGATSATLCAVGSYQNLPGQSSCVIAPPGAYVSTVGATVPHACASGTFSSAPGSTSCTAAPVGQYVPLPLSTSATNCPVGKYQPLTGQTSCLTAPAGYFVSAPGASAPTACAAGTFSATSGAASCDAAPAGTFVSTTGAMAATPCAPGSFAASAGSVACTLSPAGSFVPVSGATSATACPIGTTSGVGATSCTATAPPTIAGTPANITVTATNNAGAAVTFTLPAATDYTGASVAVTCAPASGATFAIGTTTVRCTATDRFGRSATPATFTVTVNDVTTPGAMHGDGSVNAGDDRYQFNFDVSELARSGERGRFSLEINYGKRTVLDSKGRPKQVTPDDDHFRATATTFVAFSDDPTIRPGRSATPQVDTVLFSGLGQWNGRSGYTFEIRAADQGEPGRHRESIAIVIRDSAGVIVAQASGDLASGNIQSERIHH